ncbi:hypothetical protein NPX13_g902 [Xylaria arbuscula]|uniref:Uncharacterized protein n=1 Tax=Xylaria arbuscula TaxID=114810 RepID=A0A9W8NME9_9PEZI|nr:hypothetical protein NPX13_g902 [Xylaria arbuscula]
MASGAFFDPVVVMRVAPVLTSTLAMRFSHDQWFFLSTFNKVPPEHRAKTNEIIPSYFTSFFMKGIWDIGVFYSLTPTWGVFNFYSRPNGAWKWYAAGTAFAVLHLAFAPLVSTSSPLADQIQ